MQKRKFSKRKSAPPFPPLIFIIFSLLVLFSAIGLDYIGWKKGEKSYLFSALVKKKKAVQVQEEFDQIVLDTLASQGIASETIQQFRDNKGVLHLMIDLTLKKYWELEFLLEREFKRINASVLEKEEQQGKEKNLYLWQVEGKKEKKLTILFSSRKEKIKEEEARNKVAIIIDDMGYSLKAINDICSIDRPLTISILPFTPLATETAKIARQNNLEVMLHLPLESIYSDKGNDIEGIIHSRMSEEEIIRTMETNLAQVPFISGVNNHMGSKITANKILMPIILEQLMGKDLFFIDSRTSGRSIAYEVAISLGIPSAYRHIFLDVQSDEDYIKGKLLELFRLAQKKGAAVGICHPTEETLRVLKENFHLVDKFNLQPVFASDIVH
ncbi:MAG: hypothetical protein GQ536_04055 [Candidatus Aminicenantes bacterium]|nr:hypothetical protein [Candidatus Aminicenantes bacterium]